MDTLFCKIFKVGTRDQFSPLIILLFLFSATQSWSRSEIQSEGPHSSPRALSSFRKVDPSSINCQLPPLPKGVVEIKFGDFFIQPVREAGLQITPKILGLHGQRVRILGYMVEQEEAPPGRLMLSPLPTQIHEHDNALADDLPPATVFVYVPTIPNQPVPYVPGLMLLTGVLQVGNQTEPDGRISIVRLILDPPQRAHRPRETRLSHPVASNKGGQHLVSQPSPKTPTHR